MLVSNQRLGAGLTAVIAAVALAGCGGGGSAAKGAASGGSSSATGDKITIAGFAFMPKDLKVKVGQMITVTNQDTTIHTIAADDKSFDSKDLKQNQAFTFAIKKAGTYTYICTYHQYMVGSITAS